MSSAEAVHRIEFILTNRALKRCWWAGHRSTTVMVWYLLLLLLIAAWAIDPVLLALIPVVLWGYFWRQPRSHAERIRKLWNDDRVEVTVSDQGLRCRCGSFEMSSGWDQVSDLEPGPDLWLLAVQGPSGRPYLPIDVTDTLLEVERFIRDRLNDAGGSAR